MSKALSTRQIMDALGGTREVARITSRKVSAASMWRSLGKFPPNTYLVLKAAMDAKGIAVDPTLFGMRQP